MALGKVAAAFVPLLLSVLLVPYTTAQAEPDSPGPDACITVDIWDPWNTGVDVFYCYQIAWWYVDFIVCGTNPDFCPW